MHLLTVLLENALQSVEGRQLNLLQSLILAFFNLITGGTLSELDPMKALNQC